MIDDLTILITTGLIVFVVFRAIRMDARTPWFVPRTRKPAQESKSTELPEWE